MESSAPPAPHCRRPGQGGARVLVIGLLVAVLPSAVTAQDANYWAIPYGPIGQLLGGVLIGSARDLSATYYNPGGLILTADPTFLISVDALDREKWTIESPGAPSGTFDLASTRTAAAPSIIAGGLPGGSGGTRLAWSYLPRFNTHLMTNERKITGSGSDLVASEVLVTEDMSESWFGGTWSHLTGDSLGVGVTGYLAYRGYTYRSEFNAQADPAGSGATALIVDNTDTTTIDCWPSSAWPWTGDPSSWGSRSRLRALVCSAVEI